MVSTVNSQARWKDHLTRAAEFRTEISSLSNLRSHMIVQSEHRNELKESLHPEAPTPTSDCGTVDKETSLYTAGFTARGQLFSNFLDSVRDVCQLWLLNMTKRGVYLHPNKVGLCRIRRIL